MRRTVLPTEVSQVGRDRRRPDPANRAVAVTGRAANLEPDREHHGWCGTLARVVIRRPLALGRSRSASRATAQ